MINNLTKELAESLVEMRNFADIGEIPAAAYMVRADAVLDRYVDALRTPEPEPVITRVEVISDTGRDYVNWEKDNKITTSIQDDGRTLKVFVNKVKEDIDIIKECRQTGKTRYTTKKLLDKVFGEQMTEIEEPKMPITKPEFHIEPEVIEDLRNTGNYKTFANSIADMMSSSIKASVSNQWATALSGLIDKLGGDSPALWEWEGKTPTPEKVVEYLQEHIQYLQQLAADEELEACVELLIKRYSGCTNSYTANEIASWMRNTRRPKPPQPTLKSQALKDFETVRKHSDLLPEILDTIENALKSIPE